MDDQEAAPLSHLGYRDIFYGLGLTIAGIVVTLILSVVAMAVILHGQPLKSNSIGLVAAILEIVVYAGAGVGLALLVKIRFQNRWSELGFRNARPPWIFWAVVAAPVLTAGLGVITSVLASLTHQNAGVQACMIQSSYRGAPILATFAIAVVAPIVEETLFRGVIFGALRRRWSLWPALLVSALIFAGAHALSLGGAVMIMVPELFAMGCVLAWLREHSKSIYPGMAMHGTFNLIGAIAIFVGTSACH